jgi:hypothetical protein
MIKMAAAEPWYKYPFSWSKRNYIQEVLFTCLLASGVAAVIIYIVVTNFHIAVDLERKIFPNVTGPTTAPLSR